ncbi:MAG: WYL domain-containing protein [Eubacteriales bacterium]
MAYTELIKNFERIRDYMREFYVYGFKSRDEYEKKSARSYDNERRRIESYLGDYMGFRQTPAGKNVFLSIDSRSSDHNPLYKALKAKSFTDGDITLHFILFDILYSPDIIMTINDITEKIDTEYLSCFKKPMFFDESTVRKKLKEYIGLGLIKCVKQGKQVLYSRTESTDLSCCGDAPEFFSEAGLCGIIGSYLLDKSDDKRGHFSYKHHYITHALESEILCELFKAISEKRIATIKNYTRRTEEEKTWDVIPLKIFVSVQNGRHYLIGYRLKLKDIKSFRLDYITDVKIGDGSERFNELRNQLNDIQKHMWGVSCSKHFNLEHVEFTIHIGDDEEYIVHRLERERRCGTVDRIDKNICRFTADVYDTSELIPWIRTFICRIVSMDFSNRTIENQFKRDIEDMYRLYDLGDK